ncbi:DegT/DnrJ/EryC1/StrS family aminotransferase [Pseudomonadales bacterium]|nr:DegT/DnrJ/EryC1/StrS family aminotransferase [Pseudomonadales bacterium]
MVALSTITQSLLATYGMRKIFGRIPPVGDPITIKTSNEVPIFPGALKTYFLNSGTAALAAGLQIAQQHCQAKKPEVVIPAYCCPDLLSAILYNDMKPVLVDFIPDKPYMDLNGIEEALNENTVAVIAVNFLGIPERFREIKQLLQDMPTLLIEDSCQWFPESDEAFASHEGDLVVYSFGKGKPVCLLGGGALSIRKPACEKYKVADIIGEKNTSLSKSKALFNLTKYLLYNIAISPYAYWLVELTPFIKLGETRFHPLKSIETMNSNQLIFLKKNINAYQNRSLHLFSNKHLTKNSIAPTHFIMLNDECPTYANQHLLRMPLLFKNTSTRERFIAAANDNGLGTSALYSEVLLGIQNIPDAALANQAFPYAENFSKSLLTMPTHSYAKENHLGSAFAKLN